MTFEVTILGNNSAFPAHGRFPTSQVVQHDNDMFLVDCGEGTQVRLSRYKIKRSRIDHIFISHLHGDHVYGLPGLLNSYAHFGRKRPVHIYGPKGIRLLMDTILRLSSSIVDYDIRYHELEGDGKHRILEINGLKICAFPLKHRVPTYGYMFSEKKGRINVRKEAIDKYGLTIGEIQALREGREILRGGLERSREELITERPPRAYAFCSDTMYVPELAQKIKGVDLLYHEATFLHELEDKAVISKHTTAFQAGMIARLAEAGELLIGHFSSRYDDLQPLLDEAREAFPDTRIAEEGAVFEVGSR